jgi:hypothetical protein
MNKQNFQTNRTTGIIRRITRIWSIVVIAIGVVIFVGEVGGTLLGEPGVETSYPWWENLIPLAAFIAILGLGVAFRWEAAGAILTIVMLAFSLALYIATGRTRVLQVALILTPILIPAILFLVCWARERDMGE